MLQKKKCTFRSVSVKMKLLAALQAFESIERPTSRKRDACVSVCSSALGNIHCSFSQFAVHYYYCLGYSLLLSLLWFLSPSTTHPPNRPPRLCLDNPYLFLPFELKAKSFLPETPYWGETNFQSQPNNESHVHTFLYKKTHSRKGTSRSAKRT